jgi:membrane protein YqaA with SNARE-associated domain
MSLLAVWLTTFAVCVVGSIVPFVNTEIYLLSASALAPRAFVMPLVVAATLGQSLGKVAMYYAGRGVLRLPAGRMRRGIDSVQASLEARPRAGKLLLLSSAVVGLPPLYAMAIACGAARMGLLPFVVLTTAGRFVHFAVVVIVPQLAKGLL